MTRRSKRSSKADAAASFIGDIEDDGETLTRRHRLLELLGTYDSTEVAQMLAGSRFADGGSVAILPAPTDPQDDWKARAAAYDPVAGERHDRYPGAAHWRRFCAVVAATGSIPFAARHVGIGVYKIQKRRERFPEFAVHVQQALDFFNSAVLERAAFQRAIDGVVEPVFNKGVIVGYIRRYSDALMNKLLEGNIPDKYKPKTQVDVKTEHKLVIEGGFNEEDRPMIDVTPSGDPALAAAATQLPAPSDEDPLGP